MTRSRLQLVPERKSTLTKEPELRLHACTSLQDRSSSSAHCAGSRGEGYLEYQGPIVGGLEALVPTSPSTSVPGGGCRISRCSQTAAGQHPGGVCEHAARGFRAVGCGRHPPATAGDCPPSTEAGDAERGSRAPPASAPFGRSSPGKGKNNAPRGSEGNGRSLVGLGRCGEVGRSARASGRTAGVWSDEQKATDTVHRLEFRNKDRRSAPLEARPRGRDCLAPRPSDSGSDTVMEEGSLRRRKEPGAQISGEETAEKDGKKHVGTQLSTGSSTDPRKEGDRTAIDRKDHAAQRRKDNSSVFAEQPVSQKNEKDAKGYCTRSSESLVLGGSHDPAVSLRLGGKTADLEFSDLPALPVTPPPRTLFFPGRKGGRTVVFIEEEGCTLPVHAPSIPTLNRERVLSVLAPPYRARFQSLLKLLASPPPLPKNCAHQNPPVCGFSSRTLEALWRAGHVVKAEAPSVAPTVHTFVVYEERVKKGSDGEEIEGRLRPIFWTRSLNQRITGGLKGDCYTACLPMMLSAAELLSHGAELAGALGVLRDLRGAFYQLELTPEEGQHMCFFAPSALLPKDLQGEGAGVWLRPRSLPMGAVPSPELAHLLAAAVSGLPPFCVPTPHSPSMLTEPLPLCDLYIDNLRGLASSREAAERIGECWDARAHFLGITLKESDSETGVRCYEHLGAEFCHPDKDGLGGVVGVGKKTRTKLLRTLALIRAGVRMTAVEWERALGRILFALRVIHVPLCQYPLLLLFSRKISLGLNRGCPPHTPMSPSSAFCDYMASVVERALERSPIQPASSSPNSHSLTLVSDASLWGWGAVIVDGAQRISGLGSRFHEPALTLIKKGGMVMAETIALESALSTLDRPLSQMHVDLFVDCAPVVSAVQKGNFSGRAKCSPQLNAILARIVHTLGKLRGFSVRRVPSALNVADPLSRGSACEEKVLSRLVAWKQAEGGRWARFLS